jgi:large subunit ribosomal protein L9
MEVILRTDVPKLGKAGDIVKVKDGFARNYLLPKGLAIPANQKTIKALENQRKIILAKAERERKKAQSLAEKLTGVTLTFYRKVIEGERIYGSISAQDIVKALEEKGLNLERRFVLLDEPIKQLGTYEIPIRLGPGVEVRISVEVVEEK